ncbi:MAG: DMT family transporter [Pseudomonadota bacterium]
MTQEVRPIVERSASSLGIALMVGSTLVFSLQDGISRHLAGEYNTLMVVMVRYWFFAAFVIALAARAKGGIRAAIRTRRPVLQITRGLLLGAEVCVAVYSFTVLGLIETQAVFICYPLVIAALSGPILGEQVAWRRWVAIAVGFVGVMFILQPSDGVFDPAAVIPLAAAFMFALYSLLTRYVARFDSSATSFFYTGTAGAVLLTVIGLPYWEPMNAVDSFWMGCLCITGALGHWLLIKCYEVAEASAVQPFAYFHFIWASIIGIVLFGEVIRANVALGVAIIVAAGLFTLWRERRKRRSA